MPLVKLRAAIRKAPTTLRNAIRDLRYGAFLGGLAKTRYGHLDAYDTANSAYEAMSALFEHVDVADDDVIVDIGCGKGRALNWFLSHYPDHRIYGIELDPDVCARTKRRLRRFSNVTVLCGDAADLMPAEGTLFYLFNPFGADAMQRCIDALKRTNTSTTERTIVYYNCKWVDCYLPDPQFDVTLIDLPGHHRAAIIRMAAGARA
jgi:SAM-dependent methyltransferase